MRRPWIRPDLPGTEDPAVLLGQYARRLAPRHRHRPPDDVERAACTDALVRRVRGEYVDAELELLGFRHCERTDPATDRPYSLALTPPGASGGWGVLLVDRAAPPSVLVEVPHPGADLGTEQTGVALLRRVPGAVLLMAGAHRRAGDAADVAHRTDSVFHTVAVTLAGGALGRTLPEVQLHGFDDASAPHDVVLSPGAGELSAAIRRVGDELVRRGLDVCRQWGRGCSELSGRTNAQGSAAARDGRLFLHVEMSRSTRRDARRGRHVVESLATVLPCTGAVP